MQKAAFRLPALGDGFAAVLRPLPVDAAIERLRQLADLAFLAGAVEIARGGQHARHQQRGIDQRQLALPDAAPAVHVQEVVVETLVAGRVGLVALRALPEEPQSPQRPRGSVLARHPAALDADG